MRDFGMNKQADDLILGMNRAAERAAPEAKALFIEAIKKITIQDAKNILTGGDDSATRYFRNATEIPLRGKFLPIVSNITKKIGLAEAYNRFAANAAKLRIIEQNDAKIEDYVTRKALDGLFIALAEEERALRHDPMKAKTNLVRNLLGILKR